MIKIYISICSWLGFFIYYLYSGDIYFRYVSKPSIPEVLVSIVPSLNEINVQSKHFSAFCHFSNKEFLFYDF